MSLSFQKLIRINKSGDPLEIRNVDISLLKKEIQHKKNKTQINPIFNSIVQIVLSQSCDQKVTYFIHIHTSIVYC